MKSIQFIAAFFLIFTSVLITSCETEPIDSELLAQLNNGGGTDGGDGDGGGTDGGGGTGGGTSGSNSYNFMSFSVKEGEFKNLKPAAYGLFGEMNGVSVDSYEVYDDTPTDARSLYLHLQGGTGLFSIYQIEVNISIPINLWKVGTYNLINHFDYLTNKLGNTECKIHYINLTTDAFMKVTDGKITISEFNLLTKRVKGTFSFTYFSEGVGSLDGVNSGPYYLKSGTFDYPLDDEYFK